MASCLRIDWHLGLRREKYTIWNNFVADLIKHNSGFESGIFLTSLKFESTFN